MNVQGADGGATEAVEEVEGGDQGASSETRMPRTITAEQYKECASLLSMHLHKCHERVSILCLCLQVTFA